MKKIFLSIACLIIFSAGYSQKLNWLGIDFTHTKLIGEFSQFMGAGDKNTSEVQDTYFPAWNMLMINEQDKYDIKGALGKKEVFFDIDDVAARNKAVPTASLTSYNNPTPFTKEDIKKYVAECKLPARDEIGAMLIAEVLNKNTKEGVFHLVVLNLKTKEILLTERFTGKPAGFGIRNYWAGSIMDVIEKIAKKKFKV